MQKFYHIFNKNSNSTDILEDLIDSYYTLDFLYNHLNKMNLMSTNYLINTKKVEVLVDYTGFKIEDKFIHGYSLDFDKPYKNYPFSFYDILKTILNGILK